MKAWNEWPLRFSSHGDYELSPECTRSSSDLRELCDSSVFSGFTPRAHVH